MRVQMYTHKNKGNLLTFFYLASLYIIPLFIIAIITKLTLDKGLVELFFFTIHRLYFSYINRKKTCAFSRYKIKKILGDEYTPTRIQALIIYISNIVRLFKSYQG